MARRRFFVPYVREGQAEIRGDDAHHLTQVLRVEAGQMFEISDNAAVYLAEVSVAKKAHVAFRVVQRLPDPPPELPVHLFASLFKFDRLETMIEKATELGVTTVQFVRTERSEKGLDKAAEKRIERWRRIAVEASQQSRRLKVPELLPTLPFAQALCRSTDCHRLFLDEERTGAPLIDAIRPDGRAMCLFVGPEGGWPDHERADARQAGWTPISLGSQILRAETAAIAALSVVNAVLRR